MNGLKSRCRRMSANVVMVKIPVTIEEEAKARNFGASIDDGFLLRKGLTNLLRLPLNRRERPMKTKRKCGRRCQFPEGTVRVNLLVSPETYAALDRRARADP